MRVKNMKRLHNGYLEHKSALERFPELIRGQIFGRWQYLMDYGEHSVSIVKIFGFFPYDEKYYWELADMDGEYPEVLRRFNTLKEAKSFGIKYLKDKGDNEVSP